MDPKLRDQILGEAAEFVPGTTAGDRHHEPGRLND
jgi:hypothetical protein